jgi:hypothetical protein
MAWPSSDSGDFLSGAQALTRGQDLYDRLMCAKGGGSTFYSSPRTETGSSFADKDSYFVRLPECLRSGDLIQLTILGYQSGGGTGTYRAREVDGPTNGTEQVLTASETDETSEITVPDDSWAGVVKEIAIQLKTDGTGTANSRCEEIMANLRYKT